MIVRDVAPEGSVVKPWDVLEGWAPVPEVSSSPDSDGELVSSDPSLVLVAPDPSSVVVASDALLVVVADVSVFPPDPSVVVVGPSSVSVFCPPEEVPVEVEVSPPGDSTGRVSQ